MGNVYYRGRFFASDPNDIIKKHVIKGGEDIAETLLITWYVKLDQRIRVNQYRYLSGLTKTQTGDDTWAVHDNISFVYGPWLEGKGSQNPRTRFKGYHALENARREVRQQVPEIMERNLAEAVEELG